MGKKIISFIFVFLMVMSVNVYAEVMIDINHAGVDRLVMLKGIGRKYAEKIVAYREKNGPFKKKEDILKIRGIGPAFLKNNSSRIKIVYGLKKRNKIRKVVKRLKQ